MRKKIVAGNWKMNTTVKEAVELAMEINAKVPQCDCCETSVGVVIAPPFVNLSDVSKVINHETICLAAQNCATEKNGAFTGEVSAPMLKALGVKAVILGHSERRAYYHETSEILLKKVNVVIANDMKPIFCCGEVLAEREAGIHFDVVKQQISEVLFQLSLEDFKKVIIAYEPVWAIGTGVTASPAQAQEMHAYIRSLLAEKHGNEIAENVSILYGGSCKASNAKELFENKDVDGGLIGGASLKADEFLGIVNAF